MTKTRVSTTLIAFALGITMVVGCGKFLGTSPTATMALFYTAARTDDAPGMKKYLSKASLDMMENMAKDQNKSFDDYLKQGKMGKGDNAPKVPEMRNEKIDGDNATLEVKDTENGKWETIPFVKEDGVWKIAIDKFMQPDKK